MQTSFSVFLPFPDSKHSQITNDTELSYNAFLRAQKSSDYKYNIIE